MSLIPENEDGRMVPDFWCIHGLSRSGFPDGWGWRHGEAVRQHVWREDLLCLGRFAFAANFATSATAYLRRSSVQGLG